MVKALSDFSLRSECNRLRTTKEDEDIRRSFSESCRQLKRLTVNVIRYSGRFPFTVTYGEFVRRYVAAIDRSKYGGFFPLDIDETLYTLIL